MNYVPKSIMIVMFYFTSIIPIQAQPNSLPDPVPSFMAIIVSDIDKSIEWYSTTLGFEVANRFDSDERGFSQVNLFRGSAKLELLELSNTASPSKLLERNPEFRRVQGFFKFGFSVNRFDDWINYLEEVEAQFNGDVVTDPHSGKQMMIILDPDGNRIQIFED